MHTVCEVCRSLSELPPVETRVRSAHAQAFRHAYILREGPRSLDGCHYTAYHQNVRMGMKAAAMERLIQVVCLITHRIQDSSHLHTDAK